MKAMVTFFTVWQQDITQEDMDAMDSKFYLAPVVGALIGIAVLVLCGALVWLMREGWPGSYMLVSALVLLTVYAGSRFLHFDGLTDFGDGSIVAGTQDDHVRALKDTLIGAGGLGVALIVTLISFSGYVTAGAYIVILAPVIEVLLKNAQVATAAFGKPSNGMAGKQVEMTTMGSLARSIIISILLCVAIGFAGFFVFDHVTDIEAPESLWLIYIIAAGSIVSCVVGALMARRSNRVFGMVNGDILGASHEISRAVLIIVLTSLIWVVRCRR